jgi:NADH dehydrogenase
MHRPHVLILGAGFAGLGAAEKLKKAAVDVTLIDKNNYHTFQPLLYQVATNLLGADIVGSPIRDVVHKQDNLTFHQTAVTQIDLSNRTVACKDMEPLLYDYLVLALGAQVNFFGVKGAVENAFPLYTLIDATLLKKQILTRFEAADKDPTQFEDGALNFVIVGGGPTGVEISGALAQFIFHDLVEDYPDLRVDKSRIILVDGGPALLRMFKDKSQVYTKKKLEKLGVEIWLGQRVEEVTPTNITLHTGEQLRTHTLIWAGGLQANPLVKDLHVALAPGNRLPVGPDLTLSGYPEVFVAGDIAMITDGKTAKTLPQLGSVAIQAGQHVGESIARQEKGKSTKPFKYLDKGIMANIAKGAAVLQMPHGPTLTGEAAFLSWGAVHLALLGGGGHRASALVKYGFTLFSGSRSSRIVIDEDFD